MRLFFLPVFMLQVGCSLSADAESTARKFVEFYYSADHYDDLKVMTTGHAIDKIDQERDFRNHSRDFNSHIFFQLYDHAMIGEAEYFYFKIRFLETEYERQLCVTVEPVASKFMITDFYYMKE
ncbi:hypothetical protein K1X84_05210 [bacterium]|nr:hypothetical protein [bacterium]